MRKKIRMEIFHIGAECYPVAKVGGLADVVGALPKYQNNSECLVRVVIPHYDTIFIRENEFDCVHSGFVKLGNFNFKYLNLSFKFTVFGSIAYFSSVSLMNIFSSSVNIKFV